MQLKFNFIILIFPESVYLMFCQLLLYENIFNFVNLVFMVHFDSFILVRTKPNP